MAAALGFYIFAIKHQIMCDGKYYKDDEEKSDEDIENFITNNRDIIENVALDMKGDDEESHDRGEQYRIGKPGSKIYTYEESGWVREYMYDAGLFIWEGNPN